MSWFICRRNNKKDSDVCSLVSFSDQLLHVTSGSLQHAVTWSVFFKNFVYLFTIFLPDIFKHERTYGTQTIITINKDCHSNLMLLPYMIFKHEMTYDTQTIINKDCHSNLMLLSYMSRLMTKPKMWLYAQRRLRSAWASAQSDQIRVFAVRMKKLWVLSYPLSAQRRL